MWRYLLSLCLVLMLVLACIQPTVAVAEDGDVKVDVDVDLDLQLDWSDFNDPEAREKPEESESDAPGESRVQGSTDDEEVTLSPAQVDAIWRQHWRHFARKFIAFEDEFVACPRFDPRKPSSLGRTSNELILASRRTVMVPMGGNLVRPRTTTMSVDDARILAQALPAMAVGQYGQLHSVEVEQILGPDEMIVRNAWLLDADQLAAEITRDEQIMRARDMDRQQIQAEIELVYGQRQQLAELQRQTEFRQRIRIKGLATEGLQRRQRWTGPRDGLHLAIVKIDTPPTDRRTTSTRNLPLVAVPVSQFGEGLDEKQFVQMLRGRDHTKESFANLVSRELRRDDSGMMDRVFLRLAIDRTTVEAREAEERRQRELEERRRR